MANTTTRETLDIETSGSSIVLATQGNAELALHIRSSATSVDWSIDVTDDPDNGWMTDAHTFTGGPDYDEQVTVGVSWVRVRNNTGTATANDTADVLVSASGT